MKTVLQDLRYSVRQLIKLPGFTLTAVISLALGIGATSAVFSVVYAILMDPYPYRAPDRMVHMRMLDAKGEVSGYVGLTGPQWQVIRRSPVVEDSVLTDGTWNLTVMGSDLPEDVQASYFSSNAFEYFGVPPYLGRLIEPSDAIDGQDPQPVAVLSYKFWQRHFHGDPAAIGKPIDLLHKSYIVIGVAAKRFTWDDADVYLPKKITQEQNAGYYVGLRLKPGVTHAQADAALQPLIEQFAKETPRLFPTDRKIRLHVVGLNEQFVKDLGGTLYLLFGAVALLLLIGCGNLSILLLARATARSHEFAVRAAVGASRGRIIRQLLTEALLLSLTGAGLGLGLAYSSLNMIVANLPEFSFPHEAAIRINLPVLAFSVAVAVGTGILFGLWPALQLARIDANQALQANTRKVAGSVSGRRIHAALIAGQIALTLLMLAGAGAAIEGFVRLVRLPLGYDPHNIMSVGIPLHQGTYTSWEKRSAFFESLRSQIATVPGVTMTATSSNATPPSNGFDTRFEVVGKNSADNQMTRFNMVSPEYFPALRIPLAQGRIWDQDENHRGAPVTVINQTFARRYFPAGDALGKLIKFPQVIAQPPNAYTAPGIEGGLRVIGIIEDKRDDGLSNPILPEIFVPSTVAMGMYTQVLVRSEVPPLTLLHAVQLKVHQIDPDQQTIGDVKDLEHWISDQPEWARGHLISWLFAAFAGLALALSAVGLFSVVSYLVVQRTSEFGIRLALGAQRTHLLRIVFRSAAASVGGGILAGIILSFALNRVMAHWSAESSRDPALLLASAAVLALVAAIACAVPARRAAGVDPMTAIRYE
jgi:putative ABC transport system permease protein